MAASRGPRGFYFEAPHERKNVFDNERWHTQFAGDYQYSACPCTKWRLQSPNMKISKLAGGDANAQVENPVRGGGGPGNFHSQFNEN